MISHEFGPAMPIAPTVLAPQRSHCRQIARLRLFTPAHRFSSTALCYERCTALFQALKLPMNTVKTREHGWIDAEQYDPLIFLMLLPVPYTRTHIVLFMGFNLFNLSVQWLQHSASWVFKQQNIALLLAL